MLVNRGETGFRFKGCLEALIYIAQTHLFGKMKLFVKLH